jgi:hypothetical protein
MNYGSIPERQCVQTDPEAMHSPIQWILGALSPEVKRPRIEVSNFHPVPKAESKLRYIPITPTCLNGVQRNSSDFTFVYKKE